MSGSLRSERIIARVRTSAIGHPPDPGIPRTRPERLPEAAWCPISIPALVFLATVAGGMPEPVAFFLGDLRFPPEPPGGDPRGAV